MYGFLYSQSTGLFSIEDFDGNVAALGRGYSGHGADRDNPDSEIIAGRGPIPRGVWKIHDPVHHIRLGPLAFYLEPVGHDAHWRTEFFIHGDNSRGDRSASTGCIILERRVREAIAALSSIRVLDVIL